MKTFIFLLTFLIDGSILAGSSLHQVTSVQFKTKDRVWLCLQNEAPVETCYLTHFHASIKPRSFYQVKFRLSKTEQSGHMELLSLGAQDSKAIELEVFQVKKAASAKDKRNIETSDKSYLEQHDPRTDYMIF